MAEPDGPHPIQIVLAQEDHAFDLDMEALKEVLLSEEVINRKVVVLSVAGAFRKGKSFLLDYFLRYLTNKVSGTLAHQGGKGWGELLCYVTSILHVVYSFRSSGAHFMKLQFFFRKFFCCHLNF